jgi:fission process protein 1
LGIPGGPFDPLGLYESSAHKAEINNGRLAMVTSLSGRPASRKVRSSTTRRPPTELRAIDAAVLQTCAGYAAIPTGFVGAGTFLLRREPEYPDTGDPFTNDPPAEDGEVDIYRDTALRYAGYANEVGEAFAPLTPGWCVPASYAVAITYVVADTVDKTRKVLDGDKYGDESLNKCALIEGADALIWQLAASVALPGYTIHQLVAIVVALLDASGVDQSGLISALPTACGLALIPFIITPLDELAEVGMDVTFRKLSAPFLESCEV